MTAQHDSNSGANAENGQGAVLPSAPVPARRRILVRGAAAAVPTILTLRSGAALAVTSNQIAVSDGPTADGYYRCVDESSFTRDGNRLDLGNEPSVNVTVIPENGEYFKLAIGSDPVPVTGPEMCSTGGTFNNGAGESVIVNRGALVSAAALMSFVGRATFNTTNI